MPRSIPRERPRPGLPVDLLDYLLLGLIGVTIVVSIQAVGIIMVVAMLVTPAATGQLLVSKFWDLVKVAIGVAVVASVSGLYLSFYFNVASGASIVLVETLLFAIALLFSPKSGWIVRARRAAGRDLHRRVDRRHLNPWLDRCAGGGTRILGGRPTPEPGSAHVRGVVCTHAPAGCGRAFRTERVGWLLVALAALVLVVVVDQVAQGASADDTESRFRVATTAGGNVTLFLLAVVVTIGFVLSHPTSERTFRLSQRLVPWHTRPVGLRRRFRIAPRRERPPRAVPQGHDRGGAGPGPVELPDLGERSGNAGDVCIPRHVPHRPVREPAAAGKVADDPSGLGDRVRPGRGSTSNSSAATPAGSSGCMSARRWRSAAPRPIGCGHRGGDARRTRAGSARPWWPTPPLAEAPVPEAPLVEATEG